MRLNSIRCWFVVGGSIVSAIVGGEDRSVGYDAKPNENLRRFSRQVEAVRDFPPADHRIAELRREIHRFLKTPAGMESLEPALALLLRLPASGDRPPAAPSFPFGAEQAREYQRAYAEWTGLPLEVTNCGGIAFVLIPPGSFVMGSSAKEPGHRKTPYDEAQHPVRLTQPFYLGKHETTVGQFRRFVEERKYKTDGETSDGGHAHDAKAVWKHHPGTSWRKPGFAGPFKLRVDHPVVHVSHTDAKTFCAWLARQGIRADRSKPAKRKTQGLDLPVYDLPTEAQWEWAARAGSGFRYWWGNADDTTGKVINVGDRTLKRVHPEWPREIIPADDGHAFPAPVGSYRANAFGLHDMLGNVWELCSTRYGRFSKTLAVDPGDLDPKRGFAVRGGGWSNTPQDARCATRNADPPHFCNSWTLQLLCDELGRLQVVESVCPETVRQCLKKTNCNPGESNGSASRNRTEHSVASMPATALRECRRNGRGHRRLGAKTKRNPNRHPLAIHHQRRQNQTPLPVPHT